MEKYKITVVTVCYNVVDTIEDTMKSVFAQSYPEIEYIIVDGKSTDGTLDIINRYKSKVDVVVSESDKGIYDAMNKGIQLATGDYIIFMNSGDKFNSKNSVSNIFNGLTKSVDIIYGDATFRYANGTRIVRAESHHQLKINLPFSHQSVFVKTSIMKDNPFNLDYKLAADYDFFLTAYQANCTFAYYPVVVGDVRIDDGNSYNHFYRSKREVKAIQVSHGFSKGYVVYNFYKATIWYSVKVLIKTIISPRLYNKIVTR